MKEYDVNAHAEHIFENRLDDFFNHLATEYDPAEVMWCAFDEAKQDKFAAQVGHIVRTNRWKQRAFDLLDAGNVVLWSYLRDYAQQLHDEAEEAKAANEAEAL